MSSVNNLLFKQIYCRVLCLKRGEDLETLENVGSSVTTKIPKVCLGYLKGSWFEQRPFVKRRLAKDKVVTQPFSKQQGELGRKIVRWKHKQVLSLTQVHGNFLVY
ncbi:hypothetical protein PHYBLDRAFT_65197 [Phycomyces blakesleeanus NRRL 1555(-)]|uniref:Uncharacterized protein n=1 Tax=Phycomyces blakesleeanus (strain ATCC 8743b / DSM 1359 / FGSC 10004 / NBRC 33097 / NRRL 1555) TaxID=763407 RepID=A0A162X709_PHYB8|nr:hypothetical protein PHYBLDRAFT_65197 [Phycomyces blakesleeanus NRRL 1555(-)]OAD72875.1 hypothetical protein PHYBLDRAFT_65197 [Phycomyces blakesleeanus NRRL 1555(-)]|eukprot:XP_018290915.1 hypothetical protein PHYBLDRAFT_65197 [Phycomyces blakesleeanus NRRL 1555(-)]